MHVRNTSRAWGIDVLFVRLSYISLRIRFSTFHRKLIKEWRGKRFNRTHTPQFLYPNLLPIHHFVAHQCPSHHGWQAGVSSSHRIQLASTHHTLPTLSTQRRLDQQRRIIHKKSSKLVYILFAPRGNHLNYHKRQNTKKPSTKPNSKTAITIANDIMRSTATPAKSNGTHRFYT